MSLRPMLATKGALGDLVGYVDDPDWTLQRKVNGQRALVEISAGTATVTGRDGQSSQHNALFRSPAHRAAYERLPRPVALAILDGEVVDGVLWVFDLAALEYEVGGRPCLVGPTKGFAARLAALGDLLSSWEPPPELFRLLPTALSQEDKATMAMATIAERAEGLIARRYDAPYLAGQRSPGVVKLKFCHEADLVVVELDPDGEGKANCSLGAYALDDPGRSGPIIGADGAVLALGNPVLVGTASTYGKGPIAPKDVVVVRYGAFSEDRRLIQPRIVSGARSDKPVWECTIDQLVPIGKPV